MTHNQAFIIMYRPHKQAYFRIWTYQGKGAMVWKLDGGYYLVEISLRVAGTN